MKLSKQHTDKTGKIIWVCDYGSGLSAMYNTQNKLNIPDKERVCAWCFRKSSKKIGGKG